MRMSQLSEATGVPVPTIKYYVREGLLAPGTRSLPNQASYDESHARRLGLIRALLVQGQLSVAAARRVLDAIDSELSLPEAFEIAQHATSEQLDPASVPDAALDRLDGLLAGWRYLPDNPGRIGAARILATLEEVEQRELSDFATRYAEHALGVAEADLDEVDARRIERRRSRPSWSERCSATPSSRRSAGWPRSTSPRCGTADPAR